MVYEVVCTESYLDIGLLIEENDKLKPKRVLARASAYSSEPEYGGVEILTWVHTGVFLSKDEWEHISYNKPTDHILSELGIDKKINLKKVMSKNFKNADYTTEPYHMRDYENILEDDYMSREEMAIALVKLYAEHMHTNNGNHNEDYAEAVAIAIRMLTE